MSDAPQSPSVRESSVPLTDESLPNGDSASNVDDAIAEQTGSDVLSGNSVTNGVEDGAAEEDVPPTEELTKEEFPASPVKPRSSVTEDAKGKRPAHITVKAGPSKAGPPTPTVKKILNAGTFGLGQNKNASPAKPSAAAASAGDTSPKKAASGSVPAKADPPMPVRKSTIPAPISAAASKGAPAPAVTSAPSHSRRISVVPPTPSSATSKTPAAASKAAPTTSKAAAVTTQKTSGSASTAAPKPGTHAPRKSVISPTPSSASAKAPAKPRTSVAGGTTPSGLARSTSRPSLGAAAKAVSAARPAPKAGSSSLGGVKEEVKGDSELEKKYRDAVADISAKTEQIAALEVELASVRSGLDQKLEEMSQRTTEMEELQRATSSGTEARESLEAEVKRLQEVSESLRTEQQAKVEASETKLKDTQVALEEAKTAIKALQESQASLESSLAAAQEELRNLKAIQSNESAAAAVEHEALIKAKADLDAIKAETEALSASHAVEKSDHDQTVAGLKAHVTVVEGVAESARLELEVLKREREETLQKLPELEVEILELKDAAEKAEDEKVKEIASLKSTFAAEKEELRKGLEAQVADAVKSNEDAAHQWQEAMKGAGEKHSEELTKAIKEATAAAEEAHLKTQEALAADHAEAVWTKEVEWMQKIEEVEKAAEQKNAVLQEEVKRLTTELEGQEAKYSAQVEAVKLEHDTLLKKAFQDAKIEAGAEHAQELAVLRSESQSLLENVSESHRMQVESMEASYEESKQALSKSLEKQNSTQKLELTATRDDLTKAKSSLASATSENQSLKERLQAAQKTAELAASSAAGAQSELIESLSKQLANAEKEMTDFQEILKANQLGFMDELEQTKKNHSIELEEASTSRVKALEDLQTKNDDQLAKLKGTLALLQSSLDDEREAKQQLQAQIMSLRAQTPPTTPNPKANGATSSSTATKELHALQQAHTLKISELEAEHAKALKAEQEKAEEFAQKTALLEEDVSRKVMEISFIEAEVEDLNEETKKLTAEVEHLKEQLGAK